MATAAFTGLAVTCSVANYKKSATLAGSALSLGPLAILVFVSANSSPRQLADMLHEREFCPLDGEFALTVVPIPVDPYTGGVLELGGRVMQIALALLGLSTSIGALAGLVQREYIDPS